MTVESPVRTEVQETAEHSLAQTGVRPSLSVLIAIAERHDDLRRLYGQLLEELVPRGIDFEVIFVLDGPHFPQAERDLREIRTSASAVRVYRLNRAFGEAAALRIAAAKARGQTLLSLPPYFQLAPEAIGKVLDTMKDGYDLVVGRRYPRIDSWFNRLQSFVFHRITNWLTGSRFRDLSSGLRAMKANVLQEIPLYGDLHRFVPLMAYKQGFRVVEVDVPQHPADVTTRVFRPGIYIRRLLDVLTVFFLFKFTHKPLRFFGLVGVALFVGGLGISTYLAILRLMHATALAGRPLLLLGTLLMILGMQTGALGLIGELIVFNHSRHVKEYQVDEILK